MIPSTSLNTNNYIYVRSVQTKISYTYVLGIGGLKKKYLIDDLTEKAKLLPGEALANVSIQSKLKIFLGIVIIKDFIATGQVVRFIDDKINQENVALVNKTYYELNANVGGYDGDLLSSLPITQISVNLQESVQFPEKMYGFKFAPKRAAEAYAEALYHKKGLNAWTPEAKNVMEIIIERFDKSDNYIHGYARIKDENGKIVSKILIEGGENYGRTLEERFYQAFYIAGQKAYAKWSELYMRSHQSDV